MEVGKDIFWATAFLVKHLLFRPNNLGPNFIFEVKTEIMFTLPFLMKTLLRIE